MKNRGYRAESVVVNNCAINLEKYYLCGSTWKISVKLVFAVVYKRNANAYSASLASQNFLAYIILNY